MQREELSFDKEVNSCHISDEEREYHHFDESDHDETFDVYNVKYANQKIMMRFCGLIRKKVGNVVVVEVFNSNLEPIFTAFSERAQTKIGKKYRSPLRFPVTSVPVNPQLEVMVVRDFQWEKNIYYRFTVTVERVLVTSFIKPIISVYEITPVSKISGFKIGTVNPDMLIAEPESDGYFHLKYLFRFLSSEECYVPWNITLELFDCEVTDFNECMCSILHPKLSSVTAAIAAWWNSTSTSELVLSERVKTHCIGWSCCPSPNLMVTISGIKCFGSNVKPQSILVVYIAKDVETGIVGAEPNY